MNDHTDRLSDEQVAYYVRRRITHGEDEVYAHLRAAAVELAERRAADTRTPTFTADEMEAIRTRLLLYAWHDRMLDDPQTEAKLRQLGLPESVIRWVLGESPVPCQTCSGVGFVFPEAGPSYRLPCPTCRGEQ